MVLIRRDKFKQAIKFAEIEGFILGFGFGALFGMAVIAIMLKWLGLLG